MKNSLSSDILEQQFGPSEIVVLYQRNLERIICTKVVSSGQVLELSHVQFIQTGVDTYPDVHQAIIAGQSMGKAFRERGIECTREVKYTYRQKLPTSFNKWFGTSDPATVMDVSIFVGPDHTAYARILETYSSAVSWPSTSMKSNDKQ